MIRTIARTIVPTLLPMSLQPFIKALAVGRLEYTLLQECHPNSPSMLKAQDVATTFGTVLQAIAAMKKHFDSTLEPPALNNSQNVDEAIASETLPAICMSRMTIAVVDEYDEEIDVGTALLAPWVYAALHQYLKTTTMLGQVANVNDTATLLQDDLQE